MSTVFLKGYSTISVSSSLSDTDNKDPTVAELPVDDGIPPLGAPAKQKVLPISELTLDNPADFVEILVAAE